MLLQIETTASETITLFELLTKGGFMMIPILLLWIAAVYIFIQRLLIIRRSSKTPEDFKDRIRSMVKSGDLQGAKSLCQNTDSPVARMIGKGLDRIGSPLKNIEVSIENTGKIEVYRLEKNISLYEEMQNEPILADGNATIEKFFSLTPHVGNATLWKKIRSLMGMPIDIPEKRNIEETDPYP